MIYLMKDEKIVMEFGTFPCTVFCKELLPKELSQTKLNAVPIMNYTELKMFDMKNLFEYAKNFLPQNGTDLKYTEIEKYLSNIDTPKNKYGYWLHSGQDVSMEFLTPFM